VHGPHPTTRLFAGVHRISTNSREAPRNAAPKARHDVLKFLTADPAFLIHAPFATPHALLKPLLARTAFSTAPPQPLVNMSVVGVDLGTLNTVIAVARNRGVDVVGIHGFIHASVFC